MKNTNKMQGVKMAVLRAELSRLLRDRHRMEMWCHLRGQDVDWLRKVAHEYRQRAHAAAFLTACTGCVSVMGLSLLYVGPAPSLGLLGLVALGALAGGGAMLGIVLLMLGSSRSQQVLQLLEPVHTSREFSCEAIRHLAFRSAREYRRTVESRGRALLAGDLACMRALVHEDERSIILDPGNFVGLGLHVELLAPQPQEAVA